MTRLQLSLLGVAILVLWTGCLIAFAMGAPALVRLAVGAALLGAIVVQMQKDQG